MSAPCAAALHEYIGGSRLFDSHTPRSQVDLNRAAAHNRDFRPELRQWIQAHQGDFGVLDVHSFPGTGDSWNDATANESDLVLLQTMPSDHESRVVSAVRAAGFTVAVVAGHPMVNDIVLEARQSGAKFALLLEFNESVPMSRLRACCRVIAKGLAHPPTPIT